MRNHVVDYKKLIKLMHNIEFFQTMTVFQFMDNIDKESCRYLSETSPILYIKHVSK